LKSNRNLTYCPTTTAKIGFEGRQIYLGYYQTAEEAHAAYYAKAQELFGEFARAA
jgi:hypothetical protein